VNRARKREAKRSAASWGQGTGWWHSIGSDEAIRGVVAIPDGVLCARTVRFARACLARTRAGKVLRWSEMIVRLVQDRDHGTMNPLLPEARTLCAMRRARARARLRFVAMGVAIAISRLFFRLSVA